MFIAVPSYAPSVGKGGDKIKSASAMKHGNCCFISPLAEATVQRTGQQWLNPLPELLVNLSGGQCLARYLDGLAPFNIDDKTLVDCLILDLRVRLDIAE